MAKLSPVFNDQTIDVNGDPAVGYKLFTYVANSVNTKQTTYSDEAGTIPNTNPIILNAEGWPTQGPIWLPEGVAFKMLMTYPTDTDPPTSSYKVFDDVTGVGDNTVSVSQWQTSSVTPTYVSATSFTLPGDQTSDFQVNRRIQLLTSGGTVYGYIRSSVFTTLTTVTVVLDSGVLDAGLSAVFLGLVTPDNTSAPILKDNNFRVSGSADKTKLLAFEVDGFTTATTRTLTVLDKDGTLPLVSDFNVAMNYSLVASVALNALTIAVKTASGADPSAGNPVYVPFRSATLATGSYVMRSITAPLSITVSSGSTLGTTNALASQINVLFIDNAGVVELAVFNNAGFLNLPETDFVTTTAEGGAGAADSINTVYSATARSAVPYKSAGFVVSTQATAGTWVTAPTQIQIFTTPFAPSTAWYYLPEQASTSGTSINFTGIPPWATEFDVICAQVSTNGTADIVITLGDSGGLETSGYDSGATTFGTAPAIVITSYSNAFGAINTVGAASTFVFTYNFRLENAATNTWDGKMVANRTGGGNSFIASGTKSTSAVLDRVSVTTAGGANTFDNGVIRVRFR